MNRDNVKVAMVGLGFGSEFIPIYQAHPDAEVVAICRRNETELNKTGDQFGIDRRYTDYADVLADADIDCVHINSPIADHAPMSLAALDAGKHVMCTVPMATTIDDGAADRGKRRRGFVSGSGPRSATGIGQSSRCNDSRAG